MRKTPDYSRDEDEPQAEADEVFVEQMQSDFESSFQVTRLHRVRQGDVRRPEERGEPARGDCPAEPRTGSAALRRNSQQQQEDPSEDWPGVFGEPEEARRRLLLRKLAEAEVDPRTPPAQLPRLIQGQLAAGQRVERPQTRSPDQTALRPRPRPERLRLDAPLAAAKTSPVSKDELHEDAADRVEGRELRDAAHQQVLLRASQVQGTPLGHEAQDRRRRATVDQVRPLPSSPASDRVDPPRRQVHRHLHERRHGSSLRSLEQRLVCPPATQKRPKRNPAPQELRPAQRRRLTPPHGQEPAPHLRATDARLETAAALEEAAAGKPEPHEAGPDGCAGRHEQRVEHVPKADTGDKAELQ